MNYYLILLASLSGFLILLGAAIWVMKAKTALPKEEITD
jgi:hypothetical protein